jgi:hypothetical protein
MTTNSILDTAKKLIAGDRAEAYGSFDGNAKQQAALWNAYLDDGKGGVRAIEPMDVPAMMILVKLMRLAGNNTHQDSWVDVAGFAGLAEQVRFGAKPDGVPANAFRIRRLKPYARGGQEAWAWPSGPGREVDLMLRFDDGTVTTYCPTGPTYEGDSWERV